MKRGFNIIEFIIIALIAAIFTVLAVPQYSYFLEKRSAMEGLEVFKEVNSAINKHFDPATGKSTVGPADIKLPPHCNKTSRRQDVPGLSAHCNEDAYQIRFASTHIEYIFEKWNLHIQQDSAKQLYCQASNMDTTTQAGKSAKKFCKKMNLPIK